MSHLSSVAEYPGSNVVLPQDDAGSIHTQPLLQINSSTRYAGRRDELAAIRQFRETGASVQTEHAPTLQAIMNHCFDGKHDFTLHWTAATGQWGIYGERRKTKERVLWTQEGPSASNGEPTLLVARIGVFRAILSRSAEGWRLQIGGSGESWELGNGGAETALAKAARILRKQFGQALGIVESLA